MTHNGGKEHGLSLTEKAGGKACRVEDWGLSMIRPENNAKGRNLHAPDREEHMRIYLFDQPFVSISSPSSTGSVSPAKGWERGEKSS